MKRPEDIWPIEERYQASYDEHVQYGLAEARRSNLAIVSICRSAMPHLKNTLALVDELAGYWRGCEYYVYENDSEDDTAEVLDEFAHRQWVTVEHATLDREDFRGFQPERTVRLAEYRTRCQEWVRSNAGHCQYVLVLDTDAHGGFSVNGVFNSLGWMCQMLGESWHRREVGCMASHSLFLRRETTADGEPAVGFAAYDSWAARLNWWEDRREHAWFHMLLMPVASPPVPMNSAFGGLCLYRREAYLAGVYEGGDCEHVALHRSMQKAGYQLFLNPGSRYIAIMP